MLRIFEAAKFRRMTWLLADSFFVTLVNSLCYHCCDVANVIRVARFGS